MRKFIFLVLNYLFQINYSQIIKLFLGECQLNSQRPINNQLHLSTLQQKMFKIYQILVCPRSLSVRLHQTYIFNIWTKIDHFQRSLQVHVVICEEISNFFLHPKNKSYKKIYVLISYSSTKGCYCRSVKFWYKTEA